jgi:phosphoserine phosphatase RsbU/P
MNNTFKILIADDSKVIHMSIHEFLINDLHANYSVYKAYDGREACTFAYKYKPDIILIDIEMPVMDGIEAIEKIKSNPELKAIPIIIMSSTRNFQKAFDAGADDFILKPINQLELLLRIQLNIKLSNVVNELKKQQEILQDQKTEVIAQRDTILVQQKDMVDDMNYARTIQNAIFSDTKVLKEFCNSFFIFNKPRNIVSGDFYWTAQKNEYSFFAVGDCTGHGISGALMTIAGNAFLNDITNNSNYNGTHEILNELRQRVIKLLHQKGDIGEASNGIDISLCAYNSETNEIEYSGANLPIYIKRFYNNEIEILKADRMPIGIHLNSNISFTTQKMKINKGDIIYLFSDGYADQFGGENGKKFRYKQFQQILLESSLLPMDKQLYLLEKTMNNWKKKNEQVDDMLVLGIKF